MTRFHLVRHAPTHTKAMIGWTDLPADLGDAAAIERLRGFLPQGGVIVSSDLSRASATADALGHGRLRLPDLPALREIHFGAWEGCTFDAAEAAEPARIRAFWDDPGDIAPPGGESWNALSARVLPALDDLAKEYAENEILVVAHFGPILAALQRAGKLTARAAFAHRIDPLSVTVLDLGPAGWSTTTVNHRP